MISKLKDNNIGAVKLSKEFGIDFSGVEISMTWSPAQTALQYTQNKNLFEIAELL